MISPDSRSLRPARSCFGLPARHHAPAQRVAALSDALELLRLPDSEASALSHIMPGLLCGEESSVLVISRERHRLGAQAWTASRGLFGQIAAEEEDHALLLGRLHARLPEPEVNDLLRRRSRRFFMRIEATATVADHFARIAELDACVCVLMSAFLQAPVGAHPVSRALFELIRADERRHVRASRDHVQALTGKNADDRAARAWVRASLIDLLSVVGDSFEELSIDPDVLFARIAGSRN